MSRSGIFQSLRRLVQAAHLADSLRISSRESLDLLTDRVGQVRANGLHRRDFLRRSTAVIAVAVAGHSTSASAVSQRPSKKTSPSVGIVGGGLAGLIAARTLRRYGVNVTLYEGSSRIGGRVTSLRGLFPGQVAENGGELIDNLHKTMLGLAREFDLQLEDVNKPDGEVFYNFFGQSYSEAEVVDDFRRFVPTIKDDLRGLSKEVSAVSFTPGDRRQDLISLQDYLAGNNSGSTPAPPLLSEVLRVAYTIEYGREAFDQSSINLLHFIHADNRSTFKPFGIFSDERYHIVGGNDQIVSRLAAELSSMIETGRRLVRLARLTDGRLSLTFEGTPATTRVHDRVILAIPFTTLRHVDLHPSLALPPWKTTAINNFSLGDNSKQMLGFSGRPWTALGSNGASYADLDRLQCTWETNPANSTSRRAVLTSFSGGLLATMLNPAQPQQEAAAVLHALEQVYPGSAAAASTNAGQFVTSIAHWPSNPWVRGAYTCYRPGDFTSLAGLEGIPVGNLHFAGEHTDSFYSWQGFMEGACLSGFRAAAEVLA
ncbi:MAG: flavin monoamine oxidase family protein [Planctomycetaceae bacterium]